MKRFTRSVRTGDRRVASVVALVASLAVSSSFAQSSGPMLDHTDVTYAIVDGRPLRLDVYLPESQQDAPLVVWLHGGAWQFGSKDDPPMRFVESGFALASVGFRPSTEAPFPAMVHDIKAAIRFLRANAGRFGYSAERIAVAGASSGGHLAALVAVSNGEADLEGTLGDAPEVSSEVHGAVVYFGASNLTTILAQSTPRGLRIREPSLERLLGAAPDEAEALARLASPVFHVDGGDPPLLLLHGDQDPQMPINQAHELDGAYKAAGLDVELRVVHGAGHGGDEFYEDVHWAPTAAFLRRVLAR